LRGGRIRDERRDTTRRSLYPTGNPAGAGGKPGHADLPWDAFRQRLIDAIAESRERPYYESWSVALESLVVSLGLTTPAELEAAEQPQAAL
jgi:hypothetical protein